MSSISGNFILPNMPEFASFMNDLRVTLITGLNLQREKYGFELIPENASFEFAVQKANEMVDFSNTEREQLIEYINTINDPEYQLVDKDATIQEAVDHAGMMLNGHETSRQNLVDIVSRASSQPIPSNTSLNDVIEQVRVKLNSEGLVFAGEIDMVYYGQFGYLTIPDINKIMEGKWLLGDEEEVNR